MFTGMEPYQGVEMSNKAQIDAVEHLLMAVLEEKTTRDIERVFEKAQVSIMGSAGPGGPTQKTQAFEYLRHIRTNMSD
ncbi:Uncharacterized protein ALO68_02331 [Pseudomonas syringae pv. helianthi]|uniref:Uncharacterized protein n=3 Tax=Pseudomonas syringae group genomosp. 7 TaxID=251699 RepID=A0A0P9TND1_9PSED|nr:Uncharacterized protein ALO68_02331 [Pseudomonas syringae pv. helianthi]KPY89067.1 Uncharacterized protein ALO44_00422 [Pseudomonas syringae pv. tagetis]RMR01924.1 hypothetical protein ALP93_00925 [Pseudomonas syringae pv. helianthi]RMW11312.1 hypothetical protein ALO98_00837 [Pseudomonas syringae pv. tagetis]RMW16537.1 hypothetical protein ALO97_01915 [Pseudomonas syringae pv. tagetis]